MEGLREEARGVESGVVLRRGEDQHWYVCDPRVLPLRGAERPAIHPWHEDVQDDDVRVGAPSFLQPFQAIPCEANGIALFNEDVAKAVREREVILDDKYARAIHRHPMSGWQIANATRPLGLHLASGSTLA